MFTETNFGEYIKNAYTVGGSVILRDDDSEVTYVDDDSEEGDE
jgi:hypothetical protein